MRIDGITNFNGDEIKRYITVIDSHDLSTTLRIGYGDLVMSCQNQFYSFHSAIKNRYRHSTSIKRAMQNLPRLIESAMTSSDVMVKRYQKLYETEAKEEHIHKLVNAVLGYDRVLTDAAELAQKRTVSINRMDDLYDHIEKETAQKGMNFWGLHNGVTSYTTHGLIQRGKRKNNPELGKSMVGQGLLFNTKSIDFVTEEAGLILA